MPNRCAVYGCGNEPRIGVTIHEFPVASSSVCVQWNRFIRRTRKDWDGSNKFSGICSHHFTPDCYENRMQFDMGLAKRLLLKKGAVPSIYPEGTCKTVTKSGRGATATPMTSAMRKREAHQLLAAASVGIEGEIEVHDESTIDAEEDVPEPMTKEVGTQYDPPPVRKGRSIGIQVKQDDLKKMKKTHTKGTQYQFKPTMVDKNVGASIKPKTPILTSTPIFKSQ